MNYELGRGKTTSCGLRGEVGRAERGETIDNLGVNHTIKNVQSADGKPVIVKIWDATKPIVENSNVKLIKIPKFIWFIYFVIRAAQTRGIANVAKPVEAGTFIKTK